MQVGQILKSKAQSGVVTITPDQTVGAVAELLSSRKIGAVIVSTDGRRVDGILSERDIVRELGRRGAICLEDKASQIMTANPVCCEIGENSDEIFAKMNEGRFRHMPVVEEGEMIGLISIGDVVKARLAEMAMEKTALEGMIMGF
ncbi:CBS domain-containing protein [Mangrovicoccus algicola]|uniref:CBS domain-containing protein n=1 Tax=Mangrovicoccus algicola TaxID=2771008 RepID=A0A8J6YXJ7_9RHOB|nr:CBS domain-containing protein [Mangrovicoccus algicola]MBE3637746.1 CBS domain-containing protein [Mangrovicoccus algicola]